MLKTSLKLLLAIAPAISILACSKDGDDAETSAAATSDAATSAAAPSAVATDQPQAADRTLPPAKDADHEFLRSMVDHHEGLIWITDQAQKKGTAAATRQDALKLYRAQIAARDSMLKMISSLYSETHKAEPMQHDRTQNDGLATTPAAGFDKKFYQTLVEHHRAGLAMINSALPKLTRADVKSMVEKMKAEHENEIKGFESKAGA